ncbi:hypothetical protein Tco_0497344 [Tanacetum coccineum]
MQKYTIKSIDEAALKEYDQKSTIYQTMHENKSFNRNPAKHKLYHALMEALIEDEMPWIRELLTQLRTIRDSMMIKIKTLQLDQTRGSKTSKSASAKEPVKEPIAKVVMDDVVNTAGPAYNLLKGTCTSSIELKYNFQECFNALTDKLDWNNPEGDHYPFDLSKPLPLQGHPCHLTIAIDYFFNNDQEFLKTSNSEKTYTTSITKTKSARYEIVG